jgi:hypothetical protein
MLQKKYMKKKSCFHGYSQVSQNIKNISYLIFIQNKIKKKSVCMHFMFLRTSLLKPWELSLYFKNTEKYFVLF